MKKILKLCMVLALAIGLVGCGNDNKGASNEEGKDILAQIKEAGVLKMGTSPDFAPAEFYIEQDGQRIITGRDVFLAEAIAEEIGVELEIVATNFDTVLLNVQTGQVHLGIASFSWTEARASSVQFSESYAQEAEDGWQAVMVRSEDVDKYKTMEDLKAANLTIAAQSASIQYEMALNLTDASNIMPLGDTAACAAALASGDVDAFIITSEQGNALMSTFDNIAVLPEAEFNMDPEDKYARVGVIFALGDEYASLIEVVNKVIKDAEETGKLEEWYQKAIELAPFDLGLELDEHGIVGE